MKKLLFVFALSAFLYSCESNENAGNKETPINNDTTEVTQKIVTEDDATIEELTDEEINLKSEELERKSEDINKELDDLIENL